MSDLAAGSRRLGRPTRAGLVTLIGLVLLVLLPPAMLALDQPFYISLGTRVVIYAIAAVSLDLILGYGGLVSFGHGAFVGAGAYVVGILFVHAQDGSPVLSWPVAIAGSEAALVAWPAAVVVSALLALAIGAICLRTRGVAFIMITLAFAQMLFFLFVSLPRYGGEDGISLWWRNTLPGVDLGDDVWFYYLCLALLVGFTLLCRRLVGSRFGRVLRAAKENERRLRALGVAPYPYQLTAFVIAGAGAGLAGALLANQTGFVSPSPLHWTSSGEIMVMVILGGLGTLVGPILGAAALLVLEETLSAYTSHWGLVLGPILILVVLTARRGLYGWLAGRDRGDG
jgi:branched-chain amino acid transport system permease protein